MSTPSAGSSQPGRPVESTGRSLDDAKEVGRAAETDGFAVTDGALADAAGVLVEGLWPTPGLTTVKSPNSVATARKIAPNPFDEVLSGRHEPSAYRSIVASVSVGSAARSTMLTCADAGAVNAAPWSSVTLNLYTLPAMWPSDGVPSAGTGSIDTRTVWAPDGSVRPAGGAKICACGSSSGCQGRRAGSRHPDGDPASAPLAPPCCPGGGSSQRYGSIGRTPSYSGGADGMINRAAR